MHEAERGQIFQSQQEKISQGLILRDNFCRQDGPISGVKEV